MADNRSKRKASVVRFVSKLEINRVANLDGLVELAKLLRMEGFNSDDWDSDVWKIDSGRLLKQTAKNVNSVTISFCYPPKLGGAPLNGQWAEVIKALMVLRFHRDHQALENQRNFIAAACYVAFEMDSQQLKVFQLTPEYLDKACRRISTDYAPSTAYNMYKAIGEFAAHCDANGLCNSYLDYKYSGMKRPVSTGGVGYKRLDDPATLSTSGDKIISYEVFKVIGELYKNVPKDHKYRFYVLILTLLAMLGRRLSEILLLPLQNVIKDEDGRSYLIYFPRKASFGDTFTPSRRLYLPTDVVEIVGDVIAEFNRNCASARQTAAEMEISRGPDLAFLLDIPDSRQLYERDLSLLGLPVAILREGGWLQNNGFAHLENLDSSGRKCLYTYKLGVIEYCRKSFDRHSIDPIHIDQHGRKYFLKDLLLVRHPGLSSTSHAHWVASKCTPSMVETFLRYFPDLAGQYASSSINVDFTSHHFRHTLNTFLDEGGLSDLIQTEWFGRSNPRDTKVYQNTSREKRALLMREAIKTGKADGRLADQIKKIPIHLQDAVLAARVQAVHDVGPGMCIHNFAQTPCNRHLQCSADCDDYVWVKGDTGRIEELKRLFAMTVIARETAERKTGDKKPKRSVDWLLHNDKKIKVLLKQMADYGIEPFDPHEYMKGRLDE